MANNPYVNKVELADGNVLIDISQDTVAAGKMMSGVTAHDKTGAPITGTLYSVGDLFVAENDSRNPSVILGFGTWQKRSQSELIMANLENLTIAEISQYTMYELTHTTWYVWKRTA